MAALATGFLQAEDKPLAAKTTYPEIPYYLKQLQETQLEGQRIEFNKIIHEAIVGADLSDPHVVKKMEPIIDKVRIAMDSGLDRAYLSDQSMWLNSAVQYFEREKNKKHLSVPQSDWMATQAESLTGLRITTLPDKIILFDGKTNKTIVESANIYEGVISPDGRYVAFSRRTDEASRAEVWVTDVKTGKRKKIATLPSCRTLLFSLNGGHLLLQEEQTAEKRDVPLYAVSRGGGKLKLLGKVRLLETLVAKGKYKGQFVVYKEVIHHLGTTSQECAFVITEDGNETGRIKDVACR